MDDKVKALEAEPCFGPEDPPPLSKAEVDALLALQVQLSGQQLRGNMSAVRNWIAGGDLCNCVLENSRAVGLFVAEQNLVKPGTSTVGDTFTPALSSYGSVHELMQADHLFGEMRWIAKAGTCFLVGPDTVMSAAHVFPADVREQIANRELLVVFDFQGGATSAPPAVMSKHRSVFTVVNIIREGTGEAPGTDWIVLKLDRPVSESSDRPFLRVASHELDLSREVYTLGHPNAIALRYSRSRQAWVGDDEHCFEAHLDSYLGISGAPVFDAQSHMVVGMMIRSCPADDGQVRTYTEEYLSPLCFRDDRRCGSVIISSQRFFHAI